MNLLSYRFQRQQHLTKQTHFEHVYGCCEKIENRYVRLYYAPCFQEIQKVAFIASKKLGNAVKRNKCRRRLREFYRLNQFQIHPGYDLIFVAKYKMISDDYLEMNETILYLLRKHRLLAHA